MERLGNPRNKRHLQRNGGQAEEMPTFFEYITSMGMDHMALLGNTIPEISREKGRIIKENSHTVLYDSDKSVYNIVKDICQSKNNLLFSCQGALVKDEHYGIDGTTFTTIHPKFTYKDLKMQNGHVEWK